MDCRLTLDKNESFLELVSNAYRNGEKVHLLIDDGGISRREGFIREINTECGFALIVLDQDTGVRLDKIMAVNGVFSAEYSEC